MEKLYFISLSCSGYYRRNQNDQTKQIDRQYRLFGIMAVTLGCGDAFHLVPRAYALCTTGLENYTAALGIGKFITSITMTVFYILLYYVWRNRYKIEGKKVITIAVYAMAALRIVLCLFPQNAWTSADAPLSWEFTEAFHLQFLVDRDRSVLQKCERA